MLDCIVDKLFKLRIRHSTGVADSINRSSGFGQLNERLC